MPTGERCRAVALSDKPYCYYHERLHRVPNKQKSASKKSLELHPLEDRDSVFMALSDVICALAAGRLDPRNAARLIYGLQVAGQFARASTPYIPEDAVKSFTVTEAGDELAPRQSLCTGDDEDDGNDEDDGEQDDVAAGENAA
jgi:hypothetical protein